MGMKEDFFASFIYHLTFSFLNKNELGIMLNKNLNFFLYIHDQNKFLFLMEDL